MTTETTQTIPRIENETPRAHAAKAAYVAMGPQRSLEKLRQQIGNRSVRYLEEWSSRYDWAATARAWDDQQAAAVMSEASARHIADLEQHRKQAMDAGRSLYSVAGQMLQQLNVALANPKKIKGEDGKYYTLHGIEMTSATLTTVARALTMALDLSAHSLGVDELLGRLGDGDES